MHVCVPYIVCLFLEIEKSFVPNLYLTFLLKVTMLELCHIANQLILQSQI